MYILRQKMMSVSGPIHGGSPSFKRNSIGLSTKIKGNANNHSNGKQTRKQVYKCNGQVQVQANTNASPIRFNNEQKIRFSPNPKSSIIKHRSTSTFKEIGQFNGTKHELDSQATDSFPLIEPILFAGSKSCATPSPSDLPKPPLTWMKKLPVTVLPLDLTLDSAVLAIGTEKDHLLKLKSIMK